MKTWIPLSGSSAPMFVWYFLFIASGFMFYPNAQERAVGYGIRGGRYPQQLSVEQLYILSFASFALVGASIAKRLYVAYKSKKLKRTTE